MQNRQGKRKRYIEFDFPIERERQNQYKEDKQALKAETELTLQSPPEVQE
jgi:hypothetical protein